MTKNRLMKLKNSNKKIPQPEEEVFLKEVKLFFIFSATCIDAKRLIQRAKTYHTCQ